MELVAPGQACHQKRVVEFGEWLCEEVLKYVPHRQWVFSPPKADVPYSETAANLFYDGPQTIGQAKPMRLESIESLFDASRSL